MAILFPIRQIYEPIIYEAIRVRLGCHHALLVESKLYKIYSRLQYGPPFTLLFIFVFVFVFIIDTDHACLLSWYPIYIQKIEYMLI